MDQFEEILCDHQADRIAVMNPIATFGDDLLQMGLLKKLKEVGNNFFVLPYVSEKARLYQTRNFLNRFHAPKLTCEGFEKIASSLFNRLSLKELSRAKDCDTVLIRGGGYLNDIWGDYDILRSAIRIGPNTIIIAPQSNCFNTATFKNQLDSVTQELYVFCREKYSYNLISSWHLRKNVHVYISSDTALYLSKSDFLPQNHSSVDDRSYDLICTRYDEESLVNWNLEKLRRTNKSKNSNKTHTLLVGDVDKVNSFQTWLQIIEHARRVFTDRLHVGILSAILGNDTYLYPNSYHKNRGVYEFSLFKFPNVRFVDSATFDAEKFL